MALHCISRSGFSELFSSQSVYPCMYCTNVTRETTGICCILAAIWIALSCCLLQVYHISYVLVPHLRKLVSSPNRIRSSDVRAVAACGFAAVQSTNESLVRNHVRTVLSPIVVFCAINGIHGTWTKNSVTRDCGCIWYAIVCVGEYAAFLWLLQWLLYCFPATWLLLRNVKPQFFHC